MKQLSKLSIFITSLMLTGCDKAEKTTNQQVKTESDSKMARTKTSTGLEYEILTPGSGQSIKLGQKATVHYTGWLEKNGQPDMTKKFDSSVDRNQPFSFIIGAGRVIKGWDEGVASMQVGEKRRLVIPANLGYGARGAGGVIPPNANLVFDVELIKID